MPGPDVPPGSDEGGYNPLRFTPRRRRNHEQAPRSPRAQEGRLAHRDPLPEALVAARHDRRGSPTRGAEDALRGRAMGSLDLQRAGVAFPLRAAGHGALADLLRPPRRGKPGLVQGRRGPRRGALAQGVLTERKAESRPHVRRGRGLREPGPPGRRHGPRRPRHGGLRSGPGPAGPERARGLRRRGHGGARPPGRPRSALAEASRHGGAVRAEEGGRDRPRGSLRLLSPWVSPGLRVFPAPPPAPAPPPGLPRRRPRTTLLSRKAESSYPSASPFPPSRAAAPVRGALDSLSAPCTDSASTPPRAGR